MSKLDLTNPQVWQDIQAWLDEIKAKSLEILDRQDDVTIGFVYAVMEGKRGYKTGLKLADSEAKYKIGFEAGLQFGAWGRKLVKDIVMPWLLKAALGGK